MPAVPGPLRPVAVDLIEPEGIRGEGVHRDRSSPELALAAAAVDAPAVVIGLLRRDRGAGPERRRRSGPVDVFALRLAQQAIGPARLLGQPAEIIACIVPRDVDDRAPAASPTLVGRLIAFTPAAGNAGVPFVE